MADLQIALPYQWTPRPKQQRLWDYLMGGGLRASVCWHRRFGKDDVGMRWTSCAAHTRVGSYWHMLPEKEQARKALWTMVNPHTGKKRIDEAFPLELRKRTNDQEMFIEFLNGSTWQIAGSDNYDSLVGSSPCGIVFSEYALADPASWAYLRPILRENQGWAIFISTPRGENHFFHLHQHAFTDPSWFAETLTVDDTQALTAEELATELRELQAEHGDQYGRAIWRQENYCDFTAAIPGAIWADSLDRVQLRGGIVDFEIDSSLPVFTGWDLGRTDDTAIWFYQLNGSSIDIFDHFSAPGTDIEEPTQPEQSLVHILLKKCEQYRVRLGTNWVPHDARPRRQGMGGKSILQQFHDATKRYPQLGQFALVPNLDRQEGIQAARKTFQYCRFHKTRCAAGLIALRHYHREYDTELKKYSDVPKHDWASHSADAFRYLSLSWKKHAPTVPESPLVDRLMAANPLRRPFKEHVDRLLRKRAQARAEMAG